MGLIVSVPKGCRTVPQVPDALKRASPGKQYNVPVNIATDKGAILTWFYGPTYGESTPKQNKAEQERILKSGQPIKEIGAWKGIVVTGASPPPYDHMDDLDPKSPKADRQTYFMYRGDDQVVVIALWPKGDLAAQKSGIEAAESFVKTVEINPNAKPIDFSPGSEDIKMDPEMENPPIPRTTEVVMSKGMTIEATNKEGTIKIQAGKNRQRFYTWDGETRTAIMLVQDTRWEGSLGLFYLGANHDWKENHGVTASILNEGQQNFTSEAAAMKWIKTKSNLHPVWTKSGLVVGWSKTFEKGMLFADVWQITLNHKKPTNLPGSSDGAIKVYSIQ